jgi:hypothetical protein
MSAADWANIVVTAGLGVAGFWLANSLKLRRRAEQESTAVAKRWEAYKGFWKATERAAPIRPDATPISEADRGGIHAGLTTWWFKESGGMLLGSPARELYFTAKNNLICPDDKLEPESVAVSVARREDREAARSELAIRQLSLVRTAMRADLGINARPYGRALDDLDRAFLRSAGVRLWERPWWNGSWREWLVERLRAGTS